MSYVSLAVPGSERVVWHSEWPRKPGAPILPRPPPAGYRPPNGLIWGHTFDEFCWLSRSTEIPNLVTMWSRSMIKEHGELYTPAMEELIFECPEFVAKPRRRKPWPVLKITGAGGSKAGRKLDPPLGMVDEGSDHESSHPREVFMVDSDDEDAEDSDGEDASDLVVPSRLFPIPIRDISAHGGLHWRKHIVKKRVYPQTGALRFFIKPPTPVHLVKKDQDPSVVNEEVEHANSEELISDNSDGTGEGEDCYAGNATDSTDTHAISENESAVKGDQTSATVQSASPSEESVVHMNVDGSKPVSTFPSTGAMEDVQYSDGVDSPVPADIPTPASGLPIAPVEITPDQSLTLDSKGDVSAPKDSAETAEAIIDIQAVAVEKDVEMVLTGAHEELVHGNITTADLPTLSPKPATVDPFGRKGIPKLQENIPFQYFPDTLIVHDATDLSMARDDRHYRYRDASDPRTGDVSDDEDAKTFDDGSNNGETMKEKRVAFIYKRVFPPPEAVPAHKSPDKQGNGEDLQMDGPESNAETAVGRVAHLHLSPRHSLGIGNHSHVYLSPLTLPEPLSTFTSSSARPGTVLVAAKVAIQQRNARQLLAAEAATYNGFPRHMSEEYCGLHLLSPFMRTLAPSCAVVPKFFGYYAPVYEEGDKRDSKGKLRYPWQKRSPILLMEDCGTPINASELSRDERSDCYSLLMRLHFADYLHGSFHERNIVKQPGPLTMPPLARSMKTPSFRVIDFGRTITWSEWLAKERVTDVIKFKTEAEAVEKGERSAYSNGGWWDNRKTRMTDVDTMTRNLDENPYWRCFEGKMAQEWRDARSELQFDQVEAI